MAGHREETGKPWVLYPGCQAGYTADSDALRAIALGVGRRGIFVRLNGSFIRRCEKSSMLSIGRRTGGLGIRVVAVL